MEFLFLNRLRAALKDTLKCCYLLYTCHLYHNSKTCIFFRSFYCNKDKKITFHHPVNCTEHRYREHIVLEREVLSHMEYLPVLLKYTGHIFSHPKIHIFTNSYHIFVRHISPVFYYLRSPMSQHAVSFHLANPEPAFLLLPSKG